MPHTGLKFGFVKKKILSKTKILIQTPNLNDKKQNKNKANFISFIYIRQYMFVLLLLFYLFIGIIIVHA